MPKKRSPLVQIVGLGVAATGLAHFVKPELFEDATKQAFPKDTQQHIYIDGAIETAIGLGLVVPQTRKLALVGIVAYGAYLGANVVRNR